MSNDEEKEGKSDCQTDKEAERAYYLELLREFREKESNFIQFLGIILPGIAVFAFGMDRYLGFDGRREYLILSAMACNFIFFYGIIFALSISYTCRNLQLVMSKFEKKSLFNKKITEIMGSFFGKECTETVLFFAL